MRESKMYCPCFIRMPHDFKSGKSEDKRDSCIYLFGPTEMIVNEFFAKGECASRYCIKRPNKIMVYELSLNDYLSLYLSYLCQLFTQMRDIVEDRPEIQRDVDDLWKYSKHCSSFDYFDMGDEEKVDWEDIVQQSIEMDSLHREGQGHC